MKNLWKIRESDEIRNRESFLRRKYNFYEYTIFKLRVKHEHAEISAHDSRRNIKENYFPKRSIFIKYKTRFLFDQICTFNISTNIEIIRCRKKKFVRVLFCNLIFQMNTIAFSILGIDTIIFSFLYIKMISEITSERLQF